MCHFILLLTEIHPFDKSVNSAIPKRSDSSLSYTGDEYAAT